MRDPGLRKYSLPITVAAAATPQTLYIISAGGTTTRTAIIRKIMVGYTALAGNPVLQIGTGLGGAWVAALPPFLVINAQDNEWLETGIPCVEFGANITCQSSILGIIVQIEVEEIGA